MGVHHRGDGLPPTFVANDPDSTRAILFGAFTELQQRRRFGRHSAWFTWEEAMFLASVGTDRLWAGDPLAYSSADHGLWNGGGQ